MTADDLSRAARIDAATLHEAAGRRGALPSAIQAIAPDMHVCGPAFPVYSPGGDNLWLHRAVARAAPGDVLVVRTDDMLEAGHWGEVLTVAAQIAGIAGLVIDGGVRDRMRIAGLGFPVFSASVCIGGTVKMSTVDGFPESVRIGRVEVRRGDLIVGDADGVVALSRADVADVVIAAERRVADEEKYMERLRNGETTLAIYGIPA